MNTYFYKEGEEARRTKESLEYIEKYIKSGGKFYSSIEEAAQGSPIEERASHGDIFTGERVRDDNSSDLQRLKDAIKNGFSMKVGDTITSLICCGEAWKEYTVTGFSNFDLYGSMVFRANDTYWCGGRILECKEIQKFL